MLGMLWHASSHSCSVFQVDMSGWTVFDMSWVLLSAVVIMVVPFDQWTVQS